VLLPSAHAVDREYRILAALHPTGFPVPRPYALCSDPAVIGTAFYVMEMVEGRVIWDDLMPGAMPAERRSVYASAISALARLHTIDPTAVGLGDFGKPGNYFARQVDRWIRQYRRSETESIRDMEQLIEWLPTSLPTGEAACLVHGDYRLDNIVLHPREPRVIAVLDWELSTLGHPLADFSYLCMSWHIPPGAFRGIGGVDLASLGIPSESENIHRYCDRTGLATPADLKVDWNFYLAYNLFRMAAILQGIAKRLETGTASSENAKASAAGARPLAALAWKFAQQA
jgi:aminoglycoside phosphotransferase (APT) family kinase protein